MLKARYRRIIIFFARILLTVAVWDLILPRLGFRQLARKTRGDRMRKIAMQFKKLAIHMGGVMIKVGQFLSTRADMLPEEITQVLSGLQDEVPAEKFADIQEVAEREFGMPLHKKFDFFDVQPLAAASLGQVHRARVSIKDTSTDSLEPPGVSLDEVVVKIQRPNIEQIIETDLAALNTVGVWLQHYPPIKKRANTQALLEEFSRILYEEIDYNAEGAHAETFAANFKASVGVRVPRVFWSHTTRRVLTLEDVTGIKITDYDAITQAGIARTEVASRLLDTYLKQIFEDGFFHADPHPGNLFVISECSSNEEISQWQLVFVDFGMVGRLPENTQAGLREMLMGVGTRDTERIIQSYKMLNVLLPFADVELIKKAEEKAFDRFWGKSMSELKDFSPAEIHEYLKEFRELVYTMPFQVPHDLIFLARTVAILSGICTGLDPEFNVWAHLAPYAQKLIASEGTAGGIFWLDEIGSLIKKALLLPVRLDTALQRLERGEFEVKDQQLTLQIQKLQKAVQGLIAVILLSAFVLGGIQLFLGGYPSAGIILWVLAGGVTLFLITR